MKVTNLSQLKKALAAGHDFKIIEHFKKPEHTGEIRHVSKMQTNGFYSVIKDDPESPVSKANRGLGYWLDFGKAADWLFTEKAGDVYTCTLAGVFEIEIL